MCETLRELQNHVWSKLPLGRRATVGRKAVDDLVEIAVMEFPNHAMAECVQGGRDQEALQDTLLRSCKRHYCFARGESHHNVGMIWTFILMAVASAIISEIVHWWWEKQENRNNLVKWRNAKKEKGDG